MIKSLVKPLPRKVFMSIYSVTKSPSFSEDWEIKSLQVTQDEWNELSKREIISMCDEDAKKIYDILFRGLPTYTFDFLSMRFDAYRTFKK